MKNLYAVDCDTKKDKDSVAVRTNLTLDFTGLTSEQVQEYAVDALVIKWQASQRRKDGPVQGGAVTYKVPAPGVRAQLDPIQGLNATNIDAAMAKMEEIAVAMGYKNLAEMKAARGL